MQGSIRFNYLLMERRWKVSNISNPRMTHPDGMYAAEARSEDYVSLRDHFAGLAMQGFLAHYGNNGTWDNLSEMSYQVADAMLKARKEVKP